MPFLDAALSGMTARVRWSGARVCVEAIEVPEKPTTSPGGVTSESIVVATFATNAGVSARTSIELGSESRTPLSCTLSAR